MSSNAVAPSCCSLALLPLAGCAAIRVQRTDGPTISGAWAASSFTEADAVAAHPADVAAARPRGRLRRRPRRRGRQAPRAGPGRPAPRAAVLARGDLLHPRRQGREEEAGPTPSSPTTSRRATPTTSSSTTPSRVDRHPHAQRRRPARRAAWTRSSTRASASPATSTTSASPSASSPPSASGSSTRAASSSCRDATAPRRSTSPSSITASPSGPRSSAASCSAPTSRSPACPTTTAPTAWACRSSAASTPRRRCPGTTSTPSQVEFPITAFFRFEGGLDALRERKAGRLEFVNPLQQQDVLVGKRRVPLESDLTTPMAHYLANAGLDNAGYRGFFRPDSLGAAGGLHALEPYKPGKIPVVLIHGLLSTPLTWAPMFNDLQADPTLRDRYQFWVYFYPTGNPYLVTAASLRQDLARMRQRHRPGHEGRRPRRHGPRRPQHGRPRSRACSRWRAATTSGRPPRRRRSTCCASSPDSRAELLQTYYFEKQPQVRRAIFLGTPHHGSKLSESTLGRLASRFAGLPMKLAATTRDLRDRRTPTSPPSSSNTPCRRAWTSSTPTRRRSSSSPTARARRRSATTPSSACRGATRCCSSASSAAATRTRPTASSPTPAPTSTAPSRSSSSRRTTSTSTTTRSRSSRCAASCSNTSARPTGGSRSGRWAK